MPNANNSVVKTIFGLLVIQYCVVIIAKTLAYAEFYTMPWAIIALATFMKPATLAPFT